MLDDHAIHVCVGQVAAGISEAEVLRVYVQRGVVVYDILHQDHLQPMLHMVINTYQIGTTSGGEGGCGGGCGCIGTAAAELTDESPHSQCSATKCMYVHVTYVWVMIAPTPIMIQLL